MLEEIKNNKNAQNITKIAQPAAKPAQPAAKPTQPAAKPAVSPIQFYSFIDWHLLADHGEFIHILIL